eukprot:50568-Chlamydomonas_euryale.AAC.3
MHACQPSNCWQGLPRPTCRLHWASPGRPMRKLPSRCHHRCLRAAAEAANPVPTRAAAHLARRCSWCGWCGRRPQHRTWGWCEVCDRSVATSRRRTRAGCGLHSAAAAAPAAAAAAAAATAAAAAAAAPAAAAAASQAVAPAACAAAAVATWNGAKSRPKKAPLAAEATQLRSLPGRTIHPCCRRRRGRAAYRCCIRVLRGCHAAGPAAAAADPAQLPQRLPSTPAPVPAQAPVHAPAERPSSGAAAAASKRPAAHQTRLRGQTAPPPPPPLPVKRGARPLRRCARAECDSRRPLRPPPPPRAVASAPAQRKTAARAAVRRRHMTSKM